MGMNEFKAVIGMFMMAQIYIVPLILSDNKDYKDFIDIVIPPLLIVAYLGYKLIGSIEI